jgi:hypothetical protein
VSKPNIIIILSDIHLDFFRNLVISHMLVNKIHLRVKEIKSLLKEIIINDLRRDRCKMQGASAINRRRTYYNNTRKRRDRISWLLLLAIKILIIVSDDLWDKHPVLYRIKSYITSKFFNMEAIDPKMTAMIDCPIIEHIVTYTYSDLVWGFTS